MTQTNVTDLGWLVANFAETAAGVHHAVVVSSDGLLLAMSRLLDRARADQLSAIASGLSSLTRGAARCFEAGDVNQVLVEMDGGFLLVMSISDGSCLAVLADKACDIGLVGYEMSMLVARAGAVLTPELRRHLQSVLPA